MEKETWRWNVGMLYIVVVALIWITDSFITQVVVGEGISPFLITYICNSLLVVHIPIVEIGMRLKFSTKAQRLPQPFQRFWNKHVKGETTESREGQVISHMMGQGQIEVDEDRNVSLLEVATKPYSKNRGLMRKATASVSLMIFPFWFLAQLTNIQSLKYTSVTSNTVLSSTASLFTFLVSLKYLNEKYTSLKLFSILACMGGTIIVSLADFKRGSENIAPNAILGNFFCLVSAFLYAVYTTMMRKFLLPNLSTTLYCGYLGLLNCIFLLPLLLIFHFTGLDPLHSLSLTQFLLIMGKGLMDNVLSDYLWAKAVMLTSPTAVTAGLAIQVPIAVAVDTLRGRIPRALDLAGGVAVLLGFMGINQPSWAKPEKIKVIHEPPKAIDTHDNTLQILVSS